MKADIHPKNYRDVLFVDSSKGTQYLMGSTVGTDTKAVYEVDKKEYPSYVVEISSSTHPHYTGEIKIMDTAGRLEKFKAKQAKAVNAKSSK